jgi:hypothetical protein
LVAAPWRASVRSQFKQALRRSALEREANVRATIVVGEDTPAVVDEKDRTMTAVQNEPALRLYPMAPSGRETGGYRSRILPPLIAIRAGRKHDQRMGARSSSPDLFSSAPAGEAHSRPSEPIESPSAASRHVLPADLPNAIRHLKDEELNQLASAVIAEQKRRGNKSPAEISRKQRVDVVAAVPLTQGRLNAVRAVFKAGVTLSRIARQFGISQSDICKALASEIAKG